jgi:Putative metallopeptidase
MASQGPAGPSGNTTNHGLWTIGALLGLLLSSAGSVPAQPAPSASPSFQARIEAAARALQNNPRLKNLSEQQRIDRVEFVVGNTLVLLLHEMGHVHISEMHLPVLGREEDAADTFAALRLLQIGTDFSRNSLAEAAKGWFLNDRRDQQTGEKPLFYDEHNLSQQRQIRSNSKASPTRRRCRRRAKRHASETTPKLQPLGIRS